MAGLGKIYRVKSGSTISERLRYYSKPQENGCIIWQSSKNKKGYGKYGSTLAHRVSWAAAHGKIPKGMCVLHHCDTPSCINVDHLFLGTDKDNSDDKIRKGRQKTLRGEAHGMAKLTEKDVIAIRADARIHRTIAVEYGVGVNAVRKIKYRVTWASIK